MTQNVLKLLSYEEYLDKHVDIEYNTSAKEAIPDFVFKAPNQEFGFVKSTR